MRYYAIKAKLLGNKSKVLGSSNIQGIQKPLGALIEA